MGAPHRGVGHEGPGIPVGNWEPTVLGFPVAISCAVTINCVSFVGGNFSCWGRKKCPQATSNFPSAHLMTPEPGEHAPHLGEIVEHGCSSVGGAKNVPKNMEGHFRMESGQNSFILTQMLSFPKDI